MTDTAPTGADNTINLQFVGGDLQKHVFTLADFGFTDADGDNLSGVVLTTLPFHSTSTLTGLYYNGVSALPGATISAADITDGKLVYYFQSSASADDSFTFQVVDDSGLPNNTDQTARVMDLHPRAHVQFDVSNDFAYGKGDTLHFLAGLSLSDASDTQLSTVTITSTGATSNITFDQSVLTSLGINYDDNGNEIVLTANQVDLSSWQSALKTLAFNNPGPFDTRTPDTITFDVQDSLGMSTTANIEIDYQSQLVVSATSKTNGINNGHIMNAGKVINITLDASALLENGQTLSVTGTPTLTLSNGATATYNKALSTLFAGQLIFTYTVKATDPSGVLTISAYNFSATNAVSITDASHVTTALTAGDLPFHPEFNTSIDTKVPTLSLYENDPASAQPTILPGDKLHAAETAYIRVLASEPVNITGTPTLKLSNGATATYVSPTSATGAQIYGGHVDYLYFAYTVAAGQDTADLKISSIAGAITDLVGNAANLKSLGTPDLQALVDTKAPTVTSITATATHNGQATKATLVSGDVVTIKLTMSEATHFQAAIPVIPVITLSNGGRAYYDPNASHDNLLVFNYTVSSGETSANLAITPNPDLNVFVDQASNYMATATKATNLGIKVDAQGPQVASISVSPTLGIAGTKMVFSIKLNEAATITTGATSPTLSLTNGETATYDAAASTSTVLKFNYTPSITDPNTASLNATVLHMGDMVWTDALGNVTSNSVSVPALTGVKVHTSIADTWKAGVDGDFTDATKWSVAVPSLRSGGGTPLPDLDANITASGTYTVTSDGVADGNPLFASLSTAKGVTLAITSGNFTALDGTGGAASAGKITVSNAEFKLGYGDYNLALNVNDGFNNTGTIAIGQDGVLSVSQSTSFKGGGKIILSDNGRIENADPSYTPTFTNVDNAISGTGYIGSANGGSFIFSNLAKGTVTASAGTLHFENLTVFINAGKVSTLGTAELDLNLANAFTSNSGTIAATSAGGTVSIAGTLNNSGTVAATVAGSTLQLAFGSLLENEVAGKVTVAAGATLNMISAEIEHGTASIAAKGFLNIQGNGGVSSYLRNLAFSNAGTLTISDGNSLTVFNNLGAVTTFTNTGLITVTSGRLGIGFGSNWAAPVISNKGTISLLGSSASDTSTLAFDDDTALQGGGKIMLGDSAYNIITGYGSTFTNVDNTISGSGVIYGNGLGFTLINQAKGTIIATGSNALHLQSISSIQNYGKLIGAGNGGTTGEGGLEISNSLNNSGIITTAGAGRVIIDNNALISNTAAGIVSAATAGSKVVLNDANISGGTITVAASASFEWNGGNIQNGNFSIAAKGALNVMSGNNNLLDETITNAGAINVQAGGNLWIYQGNTFTNTGTINVYGYLYAHLLSGAVNIVNAGAVEFDFSTANLAFTGDAKGHISASTFFGGSVNNFGGLDTIGLEIFDLAHVTSQITSQTATSTVLQVSDGSHLVNITFNGDYTEPNTHFVVGDDGNGYAQVSLQGVEVLNGGTQVFMATKGVDQVYNSIVSYADATSGVTVDVSSAMVQGGGIFTSGDVLSGVYKIIGSNFADTLIGNLGNDMTFTGGGGADKFYAGASHTGADTFVFTALTDSGITDTTRDTIYNFVEGQDKFVFNPSLFSPGLNFTVEADNSTTHAKVVGEVWVKTTATQTILSIDMNGDGKIDSHDMSVTVDGTGHHFNASDFSLLV